MISGRGRDTDAQNWLLAQLVVEIRNCGHRTVCRCVLPGQPDADRSRPLDYKPARWSIVSNAHETLPPAETFGMNRLVRVEERLRSVRLIRMHGNSAISEAGRASHTPFGWHGWHGCSGLSEDSEALIALHLCQASPVAPKVGICPVGTQRTCSDLAVTGTVVAGLEIIQVESRRRP